jgi:putative membrane protein
MKKFLLTDEERELIKEATAKAEKKTSGEIVTAIIRESSDYAFYELITALTGGFLSYLIALYFYDSISVFLEGLFWDYTAVYTTAFMGLLVITVSGLIYLLANIPGVDRLIVPGKIIRKSVKQRSINHFSEAGLAGTRDRTGILIFISFHEKRIELLADTGINELIPAEKWNDIVTKLVIDIQKKKTGDGIVRAIYECGELLSQHFPIKKDDTNELPNDISILED